jgi:hypothetical protein
MSYTVYHNGKISLNTISKENILLKISKLIQDKIREFNSKCLTINFDKGNHKKDIHEKISTSNIYQLSEYIRTLIDFQCHVSTTSEAIQDPNNCLYFGNTELSNKENFWFLDELQIPYEILTQEQIINRVNQIAKN